jgi:hypothetical protein
MRLRKKILGKSNWFKGGDKKVNELVSEDPDAQELNGDDSQEKDQDNQQE